MHDSGGASTEGFGMLVLGMLMTSAVAMFFSWSGATDLSDLLAQLLTICGLRFLRPIPAFFFGRFNPANVMILLPLFSASYCRSLRCFQASGYVVLCNCP